MLLHVLPMNFIKRPFDEPQGCAQEYGKRIKEASLLASKRGLGGSSSFCEKSKKVKTITEDEIPKETNIAFGAGDTIRALVPYRQEGLPHACSTALPLMRFPFPIPLSGGHYEICPDDDERLQPSSKNALVVHPTKSTTLL